MNHTDLIRRIADNTSMTANTVDAVLVALGKVAQSELSLEEGEIPLHGIGKLKASTRAARTGRNPKTGETVAIEAKNTVQFKPGKAMRDAINK